MGPGADRGRAQARRALNLRPPGQPHLVGAGSGRQAIGSSFVQPFFTYTMKTATRFTVQTEATYDWKSEQWNVPIALSVGQILKFGDQPVQLTGVARYHADSPAGGAHGWGYRAAVTFLFPK